LSTTLFSVERKRVAISAPIGYTKDILVRKE